MEVPMSETRTFGVFVELETEARAAASLDGLFFHMVNGTRRLVTCRQALVVRLASGRRPVVEAASNVAAVDRRSPFLQWFEVGVRHLVTQVDLGEVRTLDVRDFPASSTAEWSDWCPPLALWLPLKNSDGQLLGGLWLARDEPWQEPERVLLARLGDCFGHAWESLILRSRGKHRTGRMSRYRTFLRRAAGLALIALTAAGLMAPVHQSALAPAEVVAEKPSVNAAPMDGVIRAVLVRPSQSVTKGEPLFAFDDTKLMAEAKLARANLELARAELNKARQAAFLDRRAKADVAVRTEQLRLREAELAFAETLLERVIVRAEIDGIAVFSSEQDWIGRPVRTGERVMMVAAPESAILRIDLAANDVIALPDGAPVTLFLGIDPLSPIAARVVRHSYEAQPTVDGTMAFRLDARFEGNVRPRIGLRGIAKVHGREVPLFMFLFRRPMAAIRQFLGI
jgi:multidrug resistance efflux pump